MDNIFYRSKTVACALAISFAVMAAGGCTDSRYDLDNISKEVTVGGNEIILPLGKFKEKSLEDIIGEDIDGLEFDERYGAYAVKFADSGSFTVKGITLPALEDISPEIDPISLSTPTIPKTFELSAMQEQMTVDYPAMGTLPEVGRIHSSTNIDTHISFGSGTIPALGEQTLEFSGSTSFSLQFDVAEQIAGIGMLYFGEQQGDYGSPIELQFALNGMKSVNGGGHLNVRAEFPKNYTLRDTDGRELGNVFSAENRYVPEGTEKVSFRFFISKADLSEQTISGGTLDITEEIAYDFRFDFDAVAGYYNDSFRPVFSVDSDPKYHDLEIVTNEFTVDGGMHSSEMTYTFNGIPDGLADIQTLVFESAPLRLSFKGLDWLDGSMLTATMKLPSNFVFDRHNKLDSATNTLSATLAELRNGITLNLHSIDCTGDETTIGNGQLTVSSRIDTEIGRIPAGKKLLLSEIKPQYTPVTIATAVDAATLVVDLEQTKVSLRKHTYDFDFGDDNTPRIHHTLELAKEVLSIERLDIGNKQGEDVKANIRLSLPEGTSFPVDKVTLNLTVNLRQMIHLAEGQKGVETAPNGDCLIRIDNLEWRPNSQRSLDVATVFFDAICNLPELTDDGNGHRVLTIDEAFVITGSVTVDEGTDINLAAQNIKLNIDFTIDDIVVEEFIGRVEYTVIENERTEVELTDLADFNLDIDNLAIAPVFDISLDNSTLGMPFSASIVLTPYDSEGAEIEQNTVTIAGIEMAGNAVSHIIVSSEDRRTELETEGATFIPADISTLLNGQIPAKVAVAVDVRSDSENLHSIDFTLPEYRIGYDYKVDIPLDFGRTLDISYNDTITGLSDVFSDLEGQNIKVKSVAVAIDFFTSIPLDLILDAELLDEYGMRTDANIFMGDNHVIKGHDPASGAGTTKSTILLGIDLGEEGDLGALRDVEAVRLSVNLRNSSSSRGALLPEQTLSGVARLIVNGGITLDLDEL